MSQSDLAALKANQNSETLTQYLMRIGACNTQEEEDDTIPYVAGKKVVV